MTRLALALALVGTSCLGGGPTVPSLPPGGVRVLFIGNSLTYVNDLPGMVQRLARLAGNTDLATASVAFPNYALEDHWSEGTARAALVQRDWEFVVLQQGPSSLPQNQVHLATWSGQFAPLIRAAGAEPVLYMVWPSLARFDDFPEVRNSYRNAAEVVEGIFAPAGDAWMAMWETEPAPGLYSGDGFHPSQLGTYLAALVILARLTNIDPTTLPPVIPHQGGQTPLAPELAERLQAAAETALARNPTRP